MIDDRLTRIEGKIDQILEKQGKMSEVQASQAADLKYHIKRTDLLEAHVNDLQKYVFMGVGICAVLAVLVKVLL